MKKTKTKKIYTAAALTMVLGLAMSFLSMNSSSVSADTAVIDPAAVAQFKVVFIVGIVLVIISFLLLAFASMRADSKE